MEERYLCLHPDGSLFWIYTRYDCLLDDFYAAIGCDDLEHVRLPYGFGCVVDACGKVKPVPQPVNLLASALYPGSLYGDPLVGPVVFVNIDLRDGEPDWCPLRPDQLAMLEQLLGLSIPDV